MNNSSFFLAALVLLGSSPAFSTEISDLQIHYSAIIASVKCGTSQSDSTVDLEQGRLSLQRYVYVDLCWDLDQKITQSRHSFTASLYLDHSVVVGYSTGDAQSSADFPEGTLQISREWLSKQNASPETSGSLVGSGIELCTTASPGMLDCEGDAAKGIYDALAVHEKVQVIDATGQLVVGGLMAKKKDYADPKTGYRYQCTRFSRLDDVTGISYQCYVFTGSR